MRKIKPILFIITLLLFSSPYLQSQTKEIEDPYLWLENIDGKKSLEWVRAQNKLTEQAITNKALFQALKNRYLKVFNDKDQIIYPTIVGNYVYNLWQDEKNERGVWRRMPKTDFIANKSEWEAVLDLDKLSKKENKKWVLGGAAWLAPDNKICLVSLSNGGKDEHEIREFNTETKEFVKDGFYLAESKGGASWIDQNTLLICRNFGKGTLTNSGYPRIAKIWKRDSEFEKAKTIYEVDSTHMGVWPWTVNSNDKQYVFIYKAVSFGDVELYYLHGNKLKKVEFPKDAEILGLYKNELIFSLQSNWEVNNKIHKKGSLISFDLDENLKGNINIHTIYEPDNKSGFVSMRSSKDFIVVNIMENVKNKLIKYKIEDKIWIEDKINAPELGSINLISSNENSNDYFFKYSNLITPSTLYYGNDKEIRVTKKLKPVFDAKDLVIKQYEAISKDGTNIPYFIVHKNNINLNGKNPTLIYAYGGFNISPQPYYSGVRGIGWMEKGGVYVLANIRGGSEFGPSWHQAAMKEKRQNAYDDFYAVSEDLIKRNITSANYLGAFGWSNGGLLAGVVFTQRPDLYNAVVVGAPLLDMKRFSKMLAGASWMGEYGNPDIPEDWEYLKKYSPYHNILKNKKYPEVLFITSTKDDRVYPGHARKMAAKMIDMGHPLFYYETIEGGHGASSTNMQTANKWAIIFTYLNMKLNDKAITKK